MSVRIRAFGRKAYTFSARRNIVVSSAQLSPFVAYTQPFAPAQQFLSCTKRSELANCLLIVLLFTLLYLSLINEHGLSSLGKVISGKKVPTDAEICA